METKLRILVVDDYPDAAELARGWFEREGHECRAARCARDAIVEARAFKPDIVIVDIGLPDRDGLELARELRAEFPAIYIAAITGWVQADTTTRAFAAGCDHYIVKPANGNKFRFMIWHAEARRTGRDPAGARSRRDTNWPHPESGLAAPK